MLLLYVHFVFFEAKMTLHAFGTRCERVGSPLLNASQIMDQNNRNGKDIKEYQSKLFAIIIICNTHSTEIIASLLQQSPHYPQMS